MTPINWTFVFTISKCFNLRLWALKICLHLHIDILIFQKSLEHDKCIFKHVSCRYQIPNLFPRFLTFKAFKQSKKELSVNTDEKYCHVHVCTLPFIEKWIFHIKHLIYYHFTLLNVKPFQCVISLTFNRKTMTAGIIQS